MCLYVYPVRGCRVVLLASLVVLSDWVSPRYAVGHAMEEMKRTSFFRRKGKSGRLESGLERRLDDGGEMYARYQATAPSELDPARLSRRSYKRQRRGVVWEFMRRALSLFGPYVEGQMARVSHLPPLSTSYSSTASLPFNGICISSITGPSTGLLVFLCGSPGI